MNFKSLKDFILIMAFIAVSFAITSCDNGSGESSSAADSVTYTAEITASPSDSVSPSGTVILSISSVKNTTNG